MNKKLQEQITRIKKNMNITEDREHKFGCVMIYFDFPDMEKIHEEISEEDVYVDESDPSFGLEKEPHTTLLFGLHDNVTTEKVKEIVDKFKFDKCHVHNASLFLNELYDVLKFDVKGENLHECNEELSKCPHTTDFPDYHPHLTIGYLKSGKGTHHTEKLKGLEYNLIPRHIIYSKPDGSKDKINIK
jgi:2'-5' RNA ligase